MNVFKRSSDKKFKIMKKQRIEIEKLYKEWANEIEELANFYSNKTNSSAALMERYYRELKTQITKTSKQVSVETQKTIKRNVYLISDSVVEDNTKWLSSLGFDSKKINAAFSYVPQYSIYRLFEGKIYKGGFNLSSRIWGDNQRTLNDIYNIVAKGLAEQKPIEKMARDLKRYVNPKIMFDWNLKANDGVRIYKRKVDYNAQRLARTLTQHAYQISVEEVTEDNPFIEEYVWIANGSRVCDICKARDGEHFKKGEVPLDHPNGMCTIEPVVAKNISKQLKDWFESPIGTFKEIDNFVKNFK